MRYFLEEYSFRLDPSITRLKFYIRGSNILERLWLWITSKFIKSSAKGAEILQSVPWRYD